MVGCLAEQLLAEGAPIRWVPSDLPHPTLPHPNLAADLTLLKPSVLQQLASAAPVLLVAEQGSKPETGLVLSVAPLMGAAPRVDERHARWLHVEVRIVCVCVHESREGGGASQVLPGRGAMPLSLPAAASCPANLHARLAPAADCLQVRPPLRGLLKVLAASHPGNALLALQKHLVRCGWWWLGDREEP